MKLNHIIFSLLSSLIKKALLLMALAASTTPAFSQGEIQLVEPSKQGGLTIMEAIWNRHSDREFSTKDLSDQDLSDLLFAASGISRPADGKITAPSAMNTQEVDVYVFSKDGVYRYVPRGHKLQPVVEGDHRKLVAGTAAFSQDFVLEAPISLVIVTNPQKFGVVSEQSKTMAVVDGGFMSENICLFCAGKGLSTVPRATMDHAAIIKLLDLPEGAMPIINLPVGYPKQ